AASASRRGADRRAARNPGSAESRRPDARRSGIGDLPGSEPAARPQERRRRSRDIFRHPLELAGDAEKVTPRRAEGGGRRTEDGGRRAEGGGRGAGATALGGGRVEV